MWKMELKDAQLGAKMILESMNLKKFSKSSWKMLLYKNWTWILKF